MMLSNFFTEQFGDKDDTSIECPFSDGNSRFYDKNFEKFEGENIIKDKSQQFPIPRNSDDYECFQYECECWFDSQREAMKGIIFHENLSLFFRRPIMQINFYDSDGFKIGPLQQMQMEETDILQLQHDKNTVFNDLVNNRELKMNKWMLVNDPLVDWGLPKMPEPEMFNCYQEFENSSKNWYNISKQLLRAKVNNFNELKNQENNISFRDLNNPINDELEKFCLHPSELGMIAIDQKNDEIDKKQNKTHILLIKENNFLNRISKDKALNSESITKIKKLQSVYHNVFILNFDLVATQCVIDASHYGCDKYFKIDPPSDISEDYENLTILKLTQLLDLDFKVLSPKDKRSIFESCIEIINSSRSSSYPSIFMSVFYLFNIARVFIEFSPEPFELINPEFEYLQNSFLVIYHEYLFRLYFTHAIYKVLMQLKNTNVAVKIKSHLDQMFDDFYQYLQKNPFYFDFQSNIFNQTLSPTDLFVKITDTNERMLKSNSYSGKNSFNSHYPRSYSFKQKSFYNTSIENDEIDCFSTLGEPNFHLSQPFEIGNEEDDDAAVLISMYLVAFFFDITDVVCDNCFSFLSFILENSVNWYKFFVFKIISNKKLVIHFLTRVFKGDNINFLSSIHIVKFLTMLFSIDPSIVGTLPLSNYGWFFSIISRAAQFLNVSLDCANLIQTIIKFTLHYNLLKTNSKEKIKIDCIQTQGILAAFIPYEKHSKLLISELKSFSYLSTEKNALDFFKNHELTKQVLIHLRNKNYRLRHYAWKILEKIFIYHPLEIPSLLKLSGFKAVLTNVLIKSNYYVGVEMIKFLYNLLKIYIKDDKFVNLNSSKNFNLILKLMNECSFSINHIINTIKTSHKNVIEISHSKDVIRNFKVFIQKNPNIGKLLDEYELGLSISQNRKGQTRAKDFSFRKKKA